MHLEMPGEKLNNNYESLTNDEIRKQLDVLKGQIDAMNKVLEQRLEKGSSQWKADKSGNSDLNVDNIRLYMWGWKEKLEKSGVLDVIKSLKEPHKSKISEFIKSNQVWELQKYLNGQIDSKAIDQSQLESTLAQKRIWLRSGHLMEDWKFWPQTFETIKFLAATTKWSNNDKDKKTSEWTKNTKNAVNSSQGSNKTENKWEQIPEVERYEDRLAILNRINESKNDFKIKDHSGKEYTFQASLLNPSANASKDVSKNIKFEVKWKNGSMSWQPTIASFELNCGKLLDKNWKFNKEYWEKTILPDVKAKLKSQIDAYATWTECVQYLTTHCRTQKRLFPEVTVDDISKYWQLQRYFKMFEENKFEFDSTSTVFKNGKIYLQIDNISRQKSYHKAENNSSLIVDPKELCNANWKYNTTKANKKIRSIIEWIIKNQKI